MNYINILKKFGIVFNRTSTRFECDSDLNISDLLDKVSHPISVILQITRRCNFKCIFCSETSKMDDPSFNDLITIKDNLMGTARVFLSGGEPTLRSDLDKIIDLYSEDFIIGIPTNAIISDKLLKKIKEKVTFVNVGLDGPRKITSRVRGDYDRIIEGIHKIKSYNIPLSLTSVILKSTLDSVAFTCQIADILDVRKLKIVLPIPKGRALELPDEEYLSDEEFNELCKTIRIANEKYGWKPKITITQWTREVEGYSILVYPNGKTYAWPVYDQEDKVLYIGDLMKESIIQIWDRYPYKLNHLNKYLGKSIRIL